MNVSEEFKQIVGRMNEVELRALLSFAHDRLKFFHQAHDVHSLQQFNVFDDGIIFLDNPAHTKSF